MRGVARATWGRSKEGRVLDDMRKHLVPVLGPSTNFLPLIVLLAAACSKHDARLTASGEPSAAASTGATAAAVQPADDAKGKRDVAVKTMAGLKSPLDTKARDKACDAMRTLATGANDCAECRKTYAKAVVEFAPSDLAICSASDLPVIKEDAPAMCAALVDAHSKKPSAVLLGGIAAQQAQCSSQFDTLVSTVVAQMNKYDDKYGDISPADLSYLERLSDLMTADQKAKLSAATKPLSAKAKAKKRTYMADSVDKLTKKLA